MKSGFAALQKKWYFRDLKGVKIGNMGRNFTFRGE